MNAFDDVRMVGNAVCANRLKSRAGTTDSENDIIRKNMLFTSMAELDLWLQDYSVRHNRPFIVEHSDVNKRYTKRCEKQSPWKVWVRTTKDNQ